VLVCDRKTSGLCWVCFFAVKLVLELDIGGVAVVVDISPFELGLASKLPLAVPSCAVKMVGEEEDVVAAVYAQRSGSSSAGVMHRIA
jgi:hypothetical protein